jgi:hypothetical protein
MVSSPPSDDLETKAPSYLVLLSLLHSFLHYCDHLYPASGKRKDVEDHM